MKPIEVAPGEPVTVSASVSNTGGSAGTYKVELRIEGFLEDVKRVSLERGESTRVNFAVTRDETRSYTATLNDKSAGVFTVKVVMPAKIEATFLEVFPKVVEPREEVKINVGVKNAGEQAGSWTISVKVGQEIMKRTVHLGGGKSTILYFSVERMEPGEYRIRAEGLSDSFRVRKVSLLPKEKISKPKLFVPKPSAMPPILFLLIIALAALVVILYASRRTKRKQTT